MNWGLLVKQIGAASTSKAPPNPVPRSRSKAKPAKRADCALSLLKHAQLSDVREVSLEKAGINASSAHEEPAPIEGVDSLDMAVMDQLLEIAAHDSQETRLAKLLVKMTVNDLRASRLFDDAEVAHEDMFGFVSPSGTEVRLYGALQWVYGLQQPIPDEVIDGALVKDLLVDFKWCCAQLHLDHHRFRRVLARAVRPAFKGLMRAIDSVASAGFTRDCEAKLSDYVEISGWRIQ